MFCKTCGSANPDSAEFCGKCGAPVKAPGAAPTSAPIVMPPAASPYAAQGYGSPATPPRQPKKSPGLIWGIIAALIVVLGGGGGVAAYLLTRGDDGQAITATSKTTTTTNTPLTGTSNTMESIATPATPTSATTVPGPRPGGTLSVYINEPEFIDPVNVGWTEENQVANALFDSLTAWDYETGEVMPAAATSWECSDDATVWTFHLAEGATFHDGSPVTAEDFKYAWERICDPDNGSEITGYLSTVKGYDDMRGGAATELEGVRVVDDYTLEVTLYYPFSDFEYQVGHPTLAPVPKAAVETDPAGFAEQPVGNGPFMMAEPWAHDEYIRVVRYDGYHGGKAYLDGVDFKILADYDAAWTAFQAGDLDFTVYPFGETESVVSNYGESDDGLTVNPGKQVLTGPETAVYYLLLNLNEDVFYEPAVRQALSLAIDREAIAEAIYAGERVPATSIIPEGIIGYEDGAWTWSRYDVESAKARLADAGYPNGEGLPEIVISFNTGSGHEDIMAMIQADWEAIGVSAVLDGVDSSTYWDRASNGDYTVGRQGRIADYPTIGSFVPPLFGRNSDENLSWYVNGSMDEALLLAEQTVDGDVRTARYQEVVTMVGDDSPVIPIVTYRHHHVGSDRVHDLVYSPLELLSLETAWLSE